MAITQQQLQLLSREEVRWATIQLQEVSERGNRLNAEYYGVEGKRIRKLIQECIFEKKLLFATDGFVSEAYYPGRFKRIFVSNGIPIYTSSEILSLNPNSNKSISKKTKVDFEELELRPNTVVMTRSGSVGYCALVSNTLAGKIFSDDLIRISCQTETDIGYIYAFLKTRIGRILVTTNNYGSVVTHLEPEHLSSIFVPNPPETFKIKINTDIRRSYDLRDEANDLLVKADTLLFEKLGLRRLVDLRAKYFDQGGVRNFERKASKLLLRFESAFHNPLIDEIIAELKNTRFELTVVGDERISNKIVLPGRFKRIYVEEQHGVPFLGGKNILQFDSPDVKYLSLKGHSKRIETEVKFQENVILITRSGTVGNVLLTPKHFEGLAGSEHILRVIPSEKINPGYLYAFLASEYGYELIRRNIYGSVVDEIDDNQIATIPIPLPDMPTMNEIGGLVLEANKKRTEAYRLEKEAISDVEKIILNNQK